MHYTLHSFIKITARACFGAHLITRRPATRVLPSTVSTARGGSNMVICVMPYYNCLCILKSKRLYCKMENKAEQHRCGKVVQDLPVGPRHHITASLACSRNSVCPSKHTASCNVNSHPSLLFWPGGLFGNSRRAKSLPQLPTDGLETDALREGVSAASA